MADFVAGDDLALARLVERHNSGVARFARRQLGSWSLWADDVAQDVFVRVAQTANRFQGRSTFQTWMFGIALNTCREYLRREGRAHVDDHSLATLPDRSLDPLQRLERSERAELVRAAVRRLSRSHRLILRLRDREDMTYDDIARVMAVPLGTVRSRLHNARVALAHAILDSERRKGDGNGL